MNSPETPDRIKKTYSLSSETVRRIEQFAALTTRADSHVVDLAVAEMWERFQLVHRPTTTIAEAEASHASPTL